MLSRPTRLDSAGGLLKVSHSYHLLVLRTLIILISSIEFGLLGAEHYVKNLSEEEKNNIALYLNFDMVASPNAINGVYSPSASAEGVEAPAGSNAIEKIFVDFFKEHHGYSTPSEFNGRSDYGPFIVSCCFFYDSSSALLIYIYVIL